LKRNEKRGKEGKGSSALVVDYRLPGVAPEKEKLGTVLSPVGAGRRGERLFINL